MTFNTYCWDYPNFCANGFLIILNINDKKVRINTRSSVLTTVSISDSEYVIENMKPDLQRQQYGLALEKLINKIRKKKYQNPQYFSTFS